MILDDADEIDLWCRLQTGDLRIVWESDGRQYAPDFVAVETEGTHWVIEPKADRDLASPTVQGKEIAATRWAQHVSAQTGTESALPPRRRDRHDRGARPWATLRKRGLA